MSRFHALAGRPLVRRPTPEGGETLLALDMNTGAFRPAPALWDRLRPEGEVELDSLSERDFDALVADCRARIGAARQARGIAWSRTGDGEFPYRAVLDRAVLTIRVNDFPAEPLYSVLADGDWVEDLDDWPPAWSKA